MKVGWAATHDPRTKDDERRKMPEPLTIVIEPTPNPNAVKFTLSRMVASSGKTYRDVTGTDCPWATQLLQISGVTQVFALNNFISVNKTPEADWEAIMPQAQAVLRKTFE